MSTPPQIDLRVLHGGPQVPNADFQEQWRAIEVYYGVRVRRFLSDRAFDADELNDLVQKTWVRAFVLRKQFTGAGRFEAWLMAIARTVYLNHVESESALRRKHSAVAEHLMQEDPGVEHLVHRALESQQILEAVSAVDRRYLELYSQGIPHREIARTLSLGTEVAAKQRFSRLCRRLKQEFS